MQAAGSRPFRTEIGQPASAIDIEEGWLGWQGSNLRMAIPKTAALPLGYTPAAVATRASITITPRNERGAKSLEFRAVFA